MGDIRNSYSHDVRFVLKSDQFTYSLYSKDQPIGWDDDDFKLTRHKDYHGIFYSYTNDLQFTKEQSKYINDSYRIGGINTNLRLRKEVRRDIYGEVKWIVRYVAIADFNEMSTKDGKLSIKFNSLALAELMKSHQSDDFEVEREDSIDGDILTDLEINKFDLEGRKILLTAESKTANTDSITGGLFSPLTEVVNQGEYPLSDRHDAVTSDLIANALYINSQNLFFVNDVQLSENIDLNVRYELEFIAGAISGSGDGYSIVFAVFDYDENTNLYDLVSEEIVATFYGAYFNQVVEGDISFSQLTQTQGVGLFVRTLIGTTTYTPIKTRLVLSIDTFQDKISDVSFVFTHDVLERLFYIITGRNNAFYSKLFGREKLFNEDGSAKYIEDGEFGLIGNLHGYWARKFDPTSEKYKSLTISIKDALDSIKAVANVGLGIETVNFQERIRVERLDYFYRQDVVVKFPYQVTDLERKVDASMFFSGLTFGYQYGGDYENEIGLDEPNTKTDWVTPIRASSKKFVMESKIRTDEYGLELTKRKPQSAYPLEDTKRDDSIWFIDLKRPVDGFKFEQKVWSDRLEELPSGIYSPETYKSMFFTPLELMKRHAYIFTAGMIPYQDKSVRFANSKTNNTLSLQFIGEDEARAENDDFLVNELDRPIMLPEIITCEHPIDDDLMDWILGTTKVKVNGSYEDIPNYYFKMEIINDDGKKEKVFLLDLDPTGKGKLTFQKANEEILSATQVYNPYPPNVFIGGVSDVITDVSVLLQIFNYYYANDDALLGTKKITSDNIPYFKVIGDNIEFHVKHYFKSPIIEFKNGARSGYDITTMTYFVDADGLMRRIEQGTFRYQPNLEYFYAPNVYDHRSDSGYAGMDGLTGLKYIKLDNFEKSGNNFLSYATSLKTAYFPKLKNIWLQTIGSRSSFHVLSSLERMYMPMIEKINLNGIGNIATFTNVKTNCIFYVNPIMETIYLGGLDQTLAYLVSTRNAEIRYVTNDIMPNPVINVSGYNITSNSVDLSFSEPLPNTNAVDFYEVWVDDGFGLNHSRVPHQEIQSSGGTVLNLTPNTTYKIKLKTCDYLYNVSNFSNEITITTNKE